MARWILIFTTLVVPLLGACDPPATDGDLDGFLPDVDCDDNDATINPEADELCDGVDNNCNGSVDEGVMLTLYTDSDADGFGNTNAPVEACAVSPGIVEVDGDCDDTDADAYPDAEEVCDQKDNDCDAEIDEEVELTFFTDADADGFGDPDAPVLACELTAGIVEDDTDCDDAVAEINPAADELCDEVDNNCDSVIDEDTAVDAATWYRDADDDTYGNALDAVNSCSQPVGYVVDATDCNDGTDKAYPGAPEYCDEIDNNCDTVIDEDSAVDATLWYTDSDRDGFGVAPTVLQCTAPGLTWSSTMGDCDDTKSAVYPGAIEYCNGYDDDCDSTTDEDDASDAKTWFRDSDGDAFGNPSVSTKACSAPTGYLADNTDCDDTDGNTYPGADEYCDGHDDDCDGARDENDAVDAKTWYRDGDSDRYGDATLTTQACTVPSGYVSDDTDCDDSKATVYPGATEYCNTYDDDCDTVIDEDDAADATTWYVDADSDTYGDSATSKKACTMPSGYVSNATDCDDTDSTLNPATKWYYDSDLDGYGIKTSFRTQCLDPGTYYVRKDGDCLPSDRNSYPGATEVCLSGTRAEGNDNDCDGTVDEECPDIHCGTIAADTTWKDNTYGHLVTCTVYVQGSASPVLTVDAGAEVDFNNNTGLWIGYSGDGDIDIAGTTTKRVSFTSSDARPSKGDYQGLVLWSRAKGSYISGLDIEYAGSSASYPGAISIYSNDVGIDDVNVSESGQHGIYISDGAPEITDTTIQDNSKYGVYCASEKCLDPTDGAFDDNTVTKNGDAAMRVWASQVHYLSEDSTYSGNTTDEITVYGGTIKRDSTWHDLGVPYRLDNSMFVQDNTYAPVLTIDDGVELEFDTSTGMYIGQSFSGDIVVDGTSADPVLMTSSRPRPGRGDWTGLVLGYRTSSTTELNHLEVAHGGVSSSYPGSITVSSTSTTKMRDVIARDSDRHGIYVLGNAKLDAANIDAYDNDEYGIYMADNAVLTGTLSGSDLTKNAWPMRLAYEYAHLLDTTSSYDGNTNDYVELRHHNYLTTSATWKALDVPYYASESIYVGKPSGSATLTLDDGVILKMGTRLGLWVGYGSRNGDLVIDGDRGTGKGVTIESYTGGGPGTWYGIILDRGTSAVTDLAGFTLKDGGYSSSWPGGISVQYGTVSMSDCVIDDNERWGVYVVSSSTSVYSDVTIDDCEITNTATTNTSSRPDGDGLYLTNSEFHTLSLNDVSFGKNDRYPMSLHANQLTGVHAEADGSDYTSNYIDKIYSHGGYVRGKGTWEDPGVPYLVGGYTYIRNTSTAPASITTEDTEFEFGLGMGMTIGAGSYGDFAATNATFTSSRSTPLVGDWCGLHFDQYSSSNSKLDSGVVEYAGKTSGCPYYTTRVGAVSSYRAALTVNKNTISDSGTNGVYVWYSPSMKVTGNTISDNARWGVLCSASSGATVSGNTYSGNTNGNASGC